METLYAEAVYCTEGEERARGLLESVRAMAGGEKADESNKWLTMAASLAQQAIFELETRAVEVDSAIEAGDTSSRPPYTCQALVTLEALEANFTTLNSGGDMWPLFQEVVGNGNVAMVDLLILGGVDPSAENWAIPHASYKGHLAVVDRLLQDARMDPSANENWAIRMASDHGHLAVVDRLLQDARVDPSAVDNHAIRRASENGHMSIVDRLLQDARVDPSAEDNIAIQTSSINGHLSIVNRLLQDARVDPSADNNWAIQCTSRYGHLLVVERLLQDVRVDPSARNNDAIRMAANGGHFPIVKRLLQEERVKSTLTEEEWAAYQHLGG